MRTTLIKVSQLFIVLEWGYRELKTSLGSVLRGSYLSTAMQNADRCNFWVAWLHCEGYLLLVKMSQFMESHGRMVSLANVLNRALYWHELYVNVMLFYVMEFTLQCFAFETSPLMMRLRYSNIWENGWKEQTIPHPLFGASLPLRGIVGYNLQMTAEMNEKHEMSDFASNPFAFPIEYQVQVLWSPEHLCWCCGCKVACSPQSNHWRRSYEPSRSLFPNKEIKQN